MDAVAPSWIDVLELDIDLRLRFLWQEAANVTEWNLEVASAFMRAAYGKGYEDGLTEDERGSLCSEHGLKIPPQPSQHTQRNDKEERLETQLQFAHLSQVYSYLGEQAREHGMDEIPEALIEELINRAHGLAKANPNGLDALLAEFTSRAGNFHDQWCKVAEICINGAFALGIAERQDSGR